MGGRLGMRDRKANILYGFQGQSECVAAGNFNKNEMENNQLQATMNSSGEKRRKRYSQGRTRNTWAMYEHEESERPSLVHACMHAPHDACTRAVECPHATPATRATMRTAYTSLDRTRCKYNGVLRRLQPGAPGLQMARGGLQTPCNGCRSPSRPRAPP